MAMGGGRNFGTVLKIFGVAFVRALHKIKVWLYLFSGVSDSDNLNENNH